MSAIGVRTDIFSYGSKSPLLAISGHPLDGTLKLMVKTAEFGMSNACYYYKEYNFLTVIY